MTGFKSGASADDPFSDAGDADDDLETGSGSATEPTDPESRDESESPESADRDQRRETDSETTADSEPTTDGDSETDNRGLPWIYERNSITDGRKKTVQLHLQKSSLDRERDTRLDIEDVLDESVKKADLREAALLVGLEHTDQVADQLREWGYDFD